MLHAPPQAPPPGTPGPADAPFVPQLDAGSIAAMSCALHAHAIISITGLDGRIIYVNDRYCAMVKTAREELLGQHYRQLIDPGVDRHSLEQAWEMLNRGVVWSGTTRILARDASRFWLSSTVIPFFDHDGKPSRFLAIHSDITELKRTEGALRDSEARTRLLLQAADVGLWDWNLITNTCYFSPEWKRQIGYRDEELPNSFATWEALLHPEDRDATLAAVQACREGRRTVYDVEFRMRHLDGSWRWIFARANFVRDAQGAPVRMLGSHTDITERKRANEALAASEERFKYVLDATEDGVWDLNLSTGAVYFSPQWERLLGYAPGETPQQREFFYGIVHPKDRAAVDRTMQEHLDGHTPIKQLEVRLRTKAGGYCWFLDRGKVVARDAAGTPVRMVGTITDISERHAIQEALVESESRFRNIIDASPVPMALQEGGPGFSFVNPAFVQTFGYPLDRTPTIDDWWRGSYPDADQRARVKSAWRNALLHADRPGSAFEPVELSVRCSDGSSKTVLATASAFDPQRKTAYLLVLYDITALKQAQAALSNSLVEKEALLKEVHHRVKNNLQVVTSLLRLESMRRDNADTRSVLGDMQGRIRSMALLHESLYRSGLFASVELGDYLGQLVAQAFRSQACGGDAIRLHLDLHSVRVGMDQATPCGLLVNELVSNCLKHAFPDGREGDIRVELHVLPDTQQVRLRVSDTGVGLPADFQMARRASLGLQLVDDLARQIGGHLEVGPGSSFAVTFRVEDIQTPDGVVVQNG